MQGYWETYAVNLVEKAKFMKDRIQYLKDGCDPTEEQRQALINCLAVAALLEAHLSDLVCEK